MAADRTENLLIKQQERARGDFIVDGTISYVWTAIRSTPDNTSARVPGTSCGAEGGRILDTLPPECSVVAESRCGSARCGAGLVARRHNLSLGFLPAVVFNNYPLKISVVQHGRQASERQAGRFVLPVGSAL